MTLYHITTEASASRILKEGLRPREETEQQTLNGPEAPSVSTMVYLASRRQAKVILDCIASTLHLDDLCVLSVDIAGLEANLRPDEDWLNSDDALGSIPGMSTRLIANAKRMGYRIYKTDDSGFATSLLSRGEDFIFIISNTRFLYFDGPRPFLVNSIFDLYGQSDIVRTQVLDFLSCFWSEAFKDTQTLAHKGAIEASRIKLVNL